MASITLETLERDKGRFAEWRQQRRNRRDLIPEDLWRAASEHIPSLGLNRTAQEFRLSPSRLREKAELAGVLQPKPKNQTVARQPKGAFQEITLDRMFVPPAALAVVLERPDGMRLRIEGHLPDAEYVNQLAAGFLR